MSKKKKPKEISLEYFFNNQGNSSPHNKTSRKQQNHKPVSRISKHNHYYLSPTEVHPPGSTITCRDLYLIEEKEGNKIKYSVFGSLQFEGKDFKTRIVNSNKVDRNILHYIETVLIEQGIIDTLEVKIVKSPKYKKRKYLSIIKNYHHNKDRPLKEVRPNKSVFQGTYSLNKEGLKITYVDFNTRFQEIEQLKTSNKTETITLSEEMLLEQEQIQQKLISYLTVLAEEGKQGKIFVRKNQDQIIPIINFGLEDKLTDYAGNTLLTGILQQNYLNPYFDKTTYCGDIILDLPISGFIRKENQRNYLSYLPRIQRSDENIVSNSSGIELRNFIPVFFSESDISIGNVVREARIEEIGRDYILAKRIS